MRFYGVTFYRGTKGVTFYRGTKGVTFFWGTLYTLKIRKMATIGVINFRPPCKYKGCFTKKKPSVVHKKNPWSGIFFVNQTQLEQFGEGFFFVKHPLDGILRIVLNNIPKAAAGTEYEGSPPLPSGNYLYILQVLRTCVEVRHPSAQIFSACGKNYRTHSEYFFRAGTI